MLERRLLAGDQRVDGARRFPADFFRAVLDGCQRRRPGLGAIDVVITGDGHIDAGTDAEAAKLLIRPKASTSLKQTTAEGRGECGRR